VAIIHGNGIDIQTSISGIEIFWFFVLDHCYRKNQYLERLLLSLHHQYHLLVIPIHIYPCLKDVYFTQLSKFLKLSTRFFFLIYIIFFHLLWTLLAVVVGTSKDYLFLELKLIMVNGHWHTRETAIWNRLPPALYSAKSVTTFKKLYCMLLFSYCILLIRA